jgi:hypothetical protein
VAAGDHTVTLREPRYEVATTHVTIVTGKEAVGLRKKVPHLADAFFYESLQDV